MVHPSRRFDELMYPIYLIGKLRWKPTETVNNLSRSMETCKMLKIILSKLKLKKTSDSVIPHQTLFQHQLGYV